MNTWPELCLEPVADHVRRCQLLDGHDVPHSPYGDRQVIPMPSEPWTEITQGLWQGGSHTGDRNYDPNDGPFTSVLTLYSGAPWADPPLHERRFHFADGPTIPAGVDDIADWVYSQWALLGRNVLVRCKGGLNRSGLIVALALKTMGVGGADAIKLIREKRSPYALTNGVFADYVLAQR